MCNLITDGYKYSCGHYIIEHKLSKIDCDNQYCIYSKRHRNPCLNCSCDRFYGPDASETVLGVRKDFCPECKPWYRRDGR